MCLLSIYITHTHAIDAIESFKSLLLINWQHAVLRAKDRSVVSCNALLDMQQESDAWEVKEVDNGGVPYVCGSYVN